MNIQRLVYLLLLTIGIVLCSCGSPITRTETDVYTVTKLDTTKQTVVRNQPGERGDNGVIYPTTRTVETTRGLVQQDSIVKRDYPDFIRLGLFESVGTLFTASEGNKIGTGLFGIYFDPIDFLSDKIQGKSDKVFGGGLYRFGIMEYRLRWFKDAANWTIGTHGLEMFYPEAKNNTTLMSVLPLYVRKRYYLREDIPYISATGAVGLGFYPSQYIHLSGSLDVGSIGGLNLRAYAGLFAGVNASKSPLNDSNVSVTTISPYVGIGVSVLDFLNRVPELYTEWKDHEHSSWEVGLLRVDMFKSGTDSSALGDGAFPIQGYQLHIAPASIALPLPFAPQLQNRLYAGTSLFNLIVAGSNGKTILNNKKVSMLAMGFGVLPIRIGYWQPVLPDELSFEPYIEYSYYPSTIFQFGARLNLFLQQRFNVSLHAAYVSSGGFDTSTGFFKETFGQSIGEFSTFIFGISFGIQDRIFAPEELRYNRVRGE